MHFLLNHAKASTQNFARQCGLARKSLVKYAVLRRENPTRHTNSLSARNSARQAAREGSPITLIDGNELVRLVIRYELYITPVKTYVLDEFYNTEE